MNTKNVGHVPTFFCTYVINELEAHCFEFIVSEEVKCFTVMHQCMLSDDDVSNGTVVGNKL
ncbi:hypothetical protein LSI01_12390 [Furfurilactobacillus siliginis]|uniref:Uncharacterized protein n=1 Tax=Furfurilactobacillus siliginis TaxID=348151 RepID=A0A510VPQ6_9LACO|nr:hypothetical protein LSI01_12390 [Furfurilactobacillus siliginis]